MNDSYQAEREGLAQQFENAKRVLDERDSAQYKYEAVFENYQATTEPN